MGKWRNQVRKAHTAVVMKVWEAKTKLAETSGEGYVDTAVKNPDRSGIGGAASCRAVCIV